MDEPRRGESVALLAKAAALIQRTGFTAGACAIDADGRVVAANSADAVAYCVSGALRAVSGHLDDDAPGPAEQAYLAAAAVFCRHVGTTTIHEWADFPGRTGDEAVSAMVAAAKEAS